MKRTIIFSTVLIGLGIMIGVALVSNFSPDTIKSVFAQSKTIGAENQPLEASTTAQALNDAMVHVADAVLPTVVFVSVDMETTRGSNPFEEFFGFEAPEEGRRSRGSGSGVIISKSGYIVTNYHVVENAIDEGIKVVLHDKREFKAKLVGKDPLTDLAVLKIDDKADFPVAHLGDLEELRVGEFVMAVGNPLGLNSTVTSGIVSAVGRGRLGLASSGYAVENYIQTDAAINPGNSGGGLFNMHGSLVGINTAIASRTGTYIGYGFAIPIDLVKSVAEDLIDDGEINRGYIGVAIKTIENETQAKGFKVDEIAGAYVENVYPDSPAEKAGIEKYDVILEVEGKKVITSSDLQSFVALYRAGDKISLKISRDGKIITKNVTLKKLDEDQASFIDPEIKDKDERAGKSEKGPYELKQFGFTVDIIPDRLKNELDIDQGVFVTKVDRYGIAGDQGLFEGGVITEIDKKKVKGLADFKKTINSKKPGDVFLMEVKYSRRNVLIALEVPKDK